MTPGDLGPYVDGFFLDYLGTQKGLRPRAAGSNPAAPTNFSMIYGRSSEQPFAFV